MAQFLFEYCGLVTFTLNMVNYLYWQPSDWLSVAFLLGQAWDSQDAISNLAC